MSEKISGYTPIGRTPIDTDLMDSSIDLGGGSYDTRKVLLSEMKEYFKSYAWYEEGTAQPPSTINDDIYTGGNVGISMSNTDSITAKLHIKEDGVDDSLNVGGSLIVNETGNTSLIHNNIALNGSFNVFKQPNSGAIHRNTAGTSNPFHFKMVRPFIGSIRVRGFQRVGTSYSEVDIFASLQVISTGAISWNNVIDNSTNAMDSISFYTASDGQPVFKVELNNTTVDRGIVLLTYEYVCNRYITRDLTTLTESATNL